MEIREWLVENTRMGTLNKLAKKVGVKKPKVVKDYRMHTKIYQPKGNNIWLTKGDKVSIKPANRRLGVTTTGKVIDEYEQFYLLELASGRVESFHKINTEYIIKKLN